MRDQRGAVYAETLVAFLPVFTLFLATLQLADLSVAQLIVQHASTTAARAAAVVLPDDGAYYGDRDNQALHQFGGARHGDVEQAADLILRANPRLERTAANVGLDKSQYAEREDLTATVQAQYRCLLPLLCGGSVVLTSESKLVYQGAKYVYEPTELGDVRPTRQPPSGAPPTRDPSTARPPRDDGRPPAGDDRPPVADNDRPPAPRGQPPRGGRSGDDGRPGDPDRGRPPVVADNGRPPTADDGRPPLVADNGKPPAVADNGRPPTDGTARPGSAPPVDLSKPYPPTPGPLALGPNNPFTCTGVLCTVPGQCFGAGTLVHTADGDRPIETVQVGDRVWSRDQATGEVTLKRVTRRFITDDAPVLDLELVSGDRREVIKTTPDHPFWVRDVGWVKAEKLGRQALLWSPEGSLTGHAGAAWGERSKVYNLEVEESHTYFVGASHAWVHNACSLGQDQANQLGWTTPLPSGYEWVPTANGTPYLRRLPGNNNPPLRYNPSTGRFEPDADRRPTLQSGYVHLGLTPAESDELNALRNTPRHARTEAQNQRLRELTRRSEAVDFNEDLRVSISGSPEARQLARQRNDPNLSQDARNRAAEQLGERAADAFVARAFPDSTPIYAGGGSGTADRVYRNANPPPSFIVAEAKGGTATNDGSRQVGNERLQQGREDYLRDVLNDPRTINTMDAALRQELLDALDNGDVVYLEVTQPVDDAGNLGPIKVREYAPDSPRELPQTRR